jgi:hypothetical protein
MGKEILTFDACNVTRQLNFASGVELTLTTIFNLPSSAAILPSH